MPASIVTPHYDIPDFGTGATITSDSSGAWTDANTWSAGRVPTAGDIVAIASGTTVTYDVAASPALDSVVVYAGGVLTFRTDVSTQLLVTHMQVLEGGELRIGTEANPVAVSVTAQIVIRDVAIDPLADAGQFGNGLIGLGRVTMHGSERLSEVRLAGEPLAGQSVITLESAATGWRVGDRLIFPDSNQWMVSTVGTNYASQYEDGTIAAISADGKTITLAAPLQFNHPGARNGAGVLEFLPHVANRTRNVVIKSESGSGTRGYTLFTARADVDIRYATFQTLGRTTLGATGAANVADRHPVTFAHLYGPAGGQANGYQYTFVGNSIFCGMPNHNIKWGLAINDSHYGLIQGNFLYNWHGAGLITVSGNESYNVIEKNIVIRGRGIGGRAGEGEEGSAFWFRGPNNYIRDNVGANYVGDTIEAAYGFKFYFVYLGNIRVPNFRGASTAVSGEYTVRDGNALPLLEFARNEAYGIENGLTYWWVNTFGAGGANAGGESVVRDFRVWNQYAYGIYGYESNNVTIAGLKIRGNRGIGLFIGDYYSRDFVLTHADIQGMEIGVSRPSTATGETPFVIRDSYFRNSTDIAVETLYTSSYRGDWIGSRRIEIRNVKFDALPGRPHTAIGMYYYPLNVRNLIQMDQVFVYDYDQVAGQNFQLFYNEQNAAFVLPQSTFNSDGTLRRVGSPVAGWTNQQNWQTYGIAMAGAMAPATATTMAEIVGLAHPLSGTPDTTAPTVPANLTASAVSAGQINLSWTAAADNVAVVGYRIYRNGSQIGTTTSTSYASLGLAAGTTYTYTIAAYDAAGNLGSQSVAASVTTQNTAIDTTPPTISGVAASNLGTTTAAITWTTNEAADTQVEYGLTASYGSSTPLNATRVTSHTASLTGLTPGQTYHYRVTSRDAAGNLQVSEDFTFATLGPSTPSNTDNVLAFRFDEAGGPIALDASGNGYYGKYVEGPVLGQPGVLGTGSSVSLNGINQYVALPGTPFGNYGSTQSYALSFETWFNAPGGSSGVILGQTGGGSVPGGTSPYGWVPALQLGVDGRLRASLFWHNNMNARITSPDGTIYNDGKWHHVAVTYANGAEKLYVDGVQVGQQSQPEVTYSIAYQYYLGTGYSAGWTGGNGGWHFFGGKLDEAAIYQRALSSTEVAQRFAALTTGQGEPNEPVDPPPVDYGGTFYNNPELGQAGALGTSSAIGFNGTNQYGKLSAESFGSYGRTTDYALSFETWFNAPSGGSGVILGQTGSMGNPGSNGPNGWVPALHLGVDGKLRSSLFWHNNVSARLVSPGTTKYNDGQWHHVAVTYANGVETLYIDGVQVGQHSQPEVAYSTSYQYLLGTGYTQIWEGGNGGWHFYNGKLDKIGIYQRQLSGSEVAQRYAARNQ